MLPDNDRILFLSLPNNTLSASHVGPIEAIHIILFRAPILVADLAASLLCSCDFGLECRSICINPLKLRKMSIKNTHNLTQLEVPLVYISRNKIAVETYWVIGLAALANSA